MVSRTAMGQFFSRFFPLPRWMERNSVETIRATISFRGY